MSSTDIVLDSACGMGASTRFLAKEYDCKVFGVDLSRRLAQKARSVHVDGGASFLVGDGERLPFRDDTFTAVISECSMCLMPAFKAGLGEAYRTLRPGGKIGITDIAASGEIPLELEEVLMKLLCISHKISWSEYPDAVVAEGFGRVAVSDESNSLRELLEVIKKRLLLAEILKAVGKLSLGREQLDRGKRLVSLARGAVDRGNLRYVMLTGQKPLL